MKNRIIGVVFLTAILNLSQFSLLNSENSLEGYDMSNVEIVETPFWCSMTEEERTAAINNLTAEQKRVALEDGTEKPFYNLYWNHKAQGIYVDVISGEPLFSSKDKFSLDAEQNLRKYQDESTNVSKVSVSRLYFFPLIFTNFQLS